MPNQPKPPFKTKRTSWWLPTTACVESGHAFWPLKRTKDTGRQATYPNHRLPESESRPRRVWPSSHWRQHPKRKHTSLASKVMQLGISLGFPKCSPSQKRGIRSKKKKGPFVRVTSLVTIWQEPPSQQKTSKGTLGRKKSCPFCVTLFTGEEIKATSWAASRNGVLPVSPSQKGVGASKPTKHPFGWVCFWCPFFDPTNLFRPAHGPTQTKQVCPTCGMTKNLAASP